MKSRNEFAENLKLAVIAVIEARPEDIRQRINEMQLIWDTGFPVPDPDRQLTVRDVREFLESAQLFMSMFASKAEELRKMDQNHEAQVVERFIARYSKMQGETHTNNLYTFTDRLSFLKSSRI